MRDNEKPWGQAPGQHDLMVLTLALFKPFFGFFVLKGPHSVSFQEEVFNNLNRLERASVVFVGLGARYAHVNATEVVVFNRRLAVDGFVSRLFDNNAECAAMCRIAVFLCAIRPKKIKTRHQADTQILSERAICNLERGIPIAIYGRFVSIFDNTY